LRRRGGARDGHDAATATVGNTSRQVVLDDGGLG